MKYNCTLEFSDSGKILWVKLSGNIVVAELMIHGPLDKVLRAAARSRPNHTETEHNGQPLPKVFRGELFGLAGYEYLNKTEERIEEK